MSSLILKGDDGTYAFHPQHIIFVAYQTLAKKMVVCVLGNGQIVTSMSLQGAEDFRQQWQDLLERYWINPDPERHKPPLQLRPVGGEHPQSFRVVNPDAPGDDS